MWPRLLAYAPLAVPLVLVAWTAVRLLGLWMARVPYPYDLEWMEGGMLAHAWRLQHGLPLYVEPGPEFVPYIYPPGYPAVLAALGWVVPLGAPLGRAVSLLGLTGACTALGWGIWRQARSILAAVLAVGLFLGCYTASGAFYDLVRPDALALGLIAWAVVLAAERARWATFTAAVVLFLGFTVKHHAAAFGLPIALGVLAHLGWRRAALFAGVSGTLGLAFTGLMQLATGALFWTYLVTTPASHGQKVARVLPGTVWELGGALGIVLAALAVWAVWAAGRGRSPGRRVWLGAGASGVALLAAVGGTELGKAAWLGPVETAWGSLVEAIGLGRSPVSGILPVGPLPSALAFGATAALVLVAIVEIAAAVKRRWRPGIPWLVVHAGGVLLLAGVLAAVMRGHVGGYVNVHMPLHWALCLAAGLVAGTLIEPWLRAARAGSTDWRGPVLVGVVAVVAALQGGVHGARLDAAKLAPAAGDRQVGDEVVQALRGVPGPVFSPIAPWLPVMAGHTPGPHLIAIWDSKDPDGPFPGTTPALRKAVLDHYWGAIVDGDRTIDGVGRCRPTGGCQGGPLGLWAAYEVTTRLPTDGTKFRPRTGWKAKPAAILTPRAELRTAP